MKTFNEFLNETNNPYDKGAVVKFAVFGPEDSEEYTVHTGRIFAVYGNAVKIKSKGKTYSARYEELIKVVKPKS